MRTGGSLYTQMGKFLEEVGRTAHIFCHHLSGVVGVVFVSERAERHYTEHGASKRSKKLRPSTHRVFLLWESEAQQVYVRVRVG